MSMKVDFKRLKYIMHEQGEDLSYKVLADRIGKPVQFIYDAVSGKSMSEEAQKLILDALKMTPEQYNDADIIWKVKLKEQDEAENRVRRATKIANKAGHGVDYDYPDKGVKTDTDGELLNKHENMCRNKDCAKCEFVCPVGKEIIKRGLDARIREAKSEAQPVTCSMPVEETESAEAEKPQPDPEQTVENFRATINGNDIRIGTVSMEDLHGRLELPQETEKAEEQTSDRLPTESEQTSKEPEKAYSLQTARMVLSDYTPSIIDIIRETLGEVPDELTVDQMARVSLKKLEYRLLCEKVAERMREIAPDGVTV